MKKILLAEDDRNFREIICYNLRKSGYEPVAVGNGKEALLKMRKMKIDLLITDIVMPEMDGYQLCEEIAGDRDLSRIPVIVISSRKKAEIEKCNLHSYFMKPFPPEKLIGRIGEILDAE